MKEILYREVCVHKNRGHDLLADLDLKQKSIIRCKFKIFWVLIFLTWKNIQKKL